MTHHSNKCPNCGRTLTEDEIYCYFCEMEISKTSKVFEDARKSKISDITKIKKQQSSGQKNKKMQLKSSSRT